MNVGNALLHLREIRQGTHTEATGDDELGADIVFDVEVAGSLVAVGQLARVKTPAGASSDITFEVTLAADYSGPALRHDQLRECMETYYRRVVPMPWPGARSVVMEHNLFVQAARCEVELAGETGGW